MSNIPITSRVTVSLLGVFLQTRSLQVDGGSPSLWTSQQGWSDMQPLLKVHGSHFLSLAANLAFPAFPLSSWISLPVKRFLSEACQQQKFYQDQNSLFPMSQQSPKIIFTVSKKCHAKYMHYHFIGKGPLSIAELSFLPLSQRPWPAAPRTPRCSSSWCPCRGPAAARRPGCPGLRGGVSIANCDFVSALSVVSVALESSSVSVISVSLLPTVQRD